MCVRLALRIRPRAAHTRPMSVRAFSLIEVMIASALLSVGMAAILTAFSSASSLGAHQERVTTAMHLAEARMEELLLLYPDDADLAATTHAAVPYRRDGNLTTAGATGVNAPYFQVSWVIAAGPIPRTRRIDVTTSWVESGAAQRVAFTSHRP